MQSILSDFMATEYRYPMHTDLRWIADNIDQIVPMSKEDMKLRGMKMRRNDKKPNSMLFVDASGNDIRLTYHFPDGEVQRLGLSFIWPECIERDWGIREINKMRRDPARLDKIKHCLEHVNYDRLIRKINYNYY